MPDAITAEALQELRKRYTAKEPGPCRVCGAELEPGEIGPERSMYYCSSEAARWLVGSKGKSEAEKHAAWEHWSASKVTIYPGHYGDPKVLALIAAYENATASPCPEVGQDEERPAWPCPLTVRRHAERPGELWVVAPGAPEEPGIEEQTYLPSSAPNVIGTDEAPIVANFLQMPPEMDDEAVEVVTDVYRRLSRFTRRDAPTMAEDER